MKRYIPLAVAAVLLVGGCGKKDEAPASSASPAMKADNTKQSVVAPPPLPAPNVPKGAEAQLPTPGQANDHSSPAFKGGGVPDKNK